MIPIEVARHVLGILEDLGIEYYIGGSVASGCYGEPRFTEDLDVIVEITYARAAQLCSRLNPDDYYVSDSAARKAIANAGQFNIIHPSSGFKIDLMVLGGSGYDELRMSRRRRAEITPGLEAWIAAPEDVILKKLEYYKEGQSDKHLRDIASMWKVSGRFIDKGYLEQWAMRLGVSELWRHVLDRAEGRTPGPSV